MANQLGSYSLGQALTTLPFGEVVEARHTARREPLALLLLSDDLAQDQRLRGLLRLEMARAGGLRHPAISRPLEVGDHGGRLYVVYERPAGEPLTLLLATPGTPPASTARAIVGRVAAGIDVAHGRRLIHGTIGPAAVFVGPDGQTSLIGVGVMAALDDAGLAESIRPRIDTAYLAPEQATGRLAMPSADQFALGVLTERLLVADDMGAGPVSTALRAALDLQQSPQPERRYRSCAAFAAALTTATETTAAGTTPSPTNAQSPAKRAAPGPDRSESARFDAAPLAAPPPAPKPPEATEHVRPTRIPYVPPSPPVPPAEVTHRAEVASSTPESEAELAPPDGSANRVWRRVGQCQVSDMPITPEMRACIDQALIGSLPMLALKSAIPIGFGLFALGFGFVPSPFLIIFVTIAAFASGAVQALWRTAGLLQAKWSPSAVRVLGPIRSREREIKEKNSTRTVHDLDILGLASFGIEESLHYEIGHAVGFSHATTLPWPTPPDGSTCYELRGAMVTYSRTISPLPFEVRLPTGLRIWKHPDYDDRE